MSGRLAGYAAEIERYLRMPGAGDLEELNDDKLLQAAGRETADRQAMNIRASGVTFKVLSSAANGKQAGALLAYVGTRVNEQGEKRDIEIFTDSGNGLANAQDRRGFLHQFTETFQAQLENTNFIEVRFELAGDVTDEALGEALNAAFGSKPFVYARTGDSVAVYGHTGERAGPLAKILAAGRANSRSKALDKIEAGLDEAMGKAGIRAAAEVTAAVGNERKAQYFLQKFIRAHEQVRRANGQAVSSKQPTKAAAAIFEEWRPQLSGRERRNAYHLLFSARAGTDAQAIMAAARAVLEERAPGHKFVLAHHAETKHVHIHAMVQARSADGERLTFYKADLHAWREAYAEKAREHGIAMAATRRYDHAMSRPYTKEHAGAYKRAQHDPRYQVSDKTVARVEDKRQRRMDSGLLVANGGAIAAVWQQTATVMRAAGVTGQALTAAEAIGHTVLQVHAHRGGEEPADARSKYGGGPRLTPSFLSHPGMKELTRLIGATEMAQTPLEMRQKMARVNQALDEMRDTLPNAEQTRFEQYRDGVNDKMHDRLARLQFEQQKGAGGGGEAAPQREARDRDLPSLDDTRQPETSGPQAEKARQRVQQQKDSAKQKGRQADEQDRKAQRSQDDEHER
ncbi:relaxase/mobilization nuclease domain-containing protein [Mesorhizobium sp.]|uniref:relaxase/mobilization nuclease domain-containing protein n=1 Tax=Mesorhizobium sp. TaxID=1871066 RepID=UPI000FE6221D|nr:relaxase/mobilization nuclease domain-containing protein [Mesorhizobium sp.]RWQ13622.1 MAG: hypothetical protein EOR93_31445 [Mesorhizobium sp.]